MAGLFPEPAATYSMDGMAPVSGRMYDGGPRSYGDDPWQRRNIVGGGSLNWLGATLADELASYSQAQQAATIGAPASPLSFDFKLEIPEFPPLNLTLGDFSVPPAAVYTGPAAAPTAPNVAVGGQIPPFQPPPAGRAQLPGGAGGGGGGLPPARLVLHPLLNRLGKGVGHSDTAVVVPADGDLIYRKLGAWDRMPKAAGQHYHMTSDANSLPQWAPQGVASSTRHTLQNDAADDGPVIYVNTSSPPSIVFGGVKTTIVSGVITAEANSLRLIGLNGDNWVSVAVTLAVPGVSAGSIDLSHNVAQAPALYKTATIGCGTLTATTDANGHLIGIGYA